MNTKELYKNGFEEYPYSIVISQNLFFLLYFGTGFTGILSLKIFEIPLISILYAIFIVVMLLFVLRKHLCTNCYYYGKRCSTGWGKLSSLMFKEKSGNYELGIKLANITWALATLTPIIGIIISLFINFSGYKLALLLLFVVLTPVNFLFHKNSCKRCKLRNICPASMSKEKR